MPGEYAIVPWNKEIWLTTVLPFVLLAVVTYFILSQPSKLAIIVSLLVLLPAWLIQVVALLFAPAGYVLADATIKVCRPIGAISIPYSELHSIELVEQAYPALRIMASGGFGGYFGRFRMADGKETLVYSTRWKKVISITSISGNYIISPADPEAFLNAVKERASL